VSRATDSSIMNSSRTMINHVVGPVSLNVTNGWAISATLLIHNNDAAPARLRGRFGIDER